MRDDCSICDEATAALRAENDTLKARVKELEDELSATGQSLADTHEALVKVESQLAKIREAWEDIKASCGVPLIKDAPAWARAVKNMEDALK